MINLTKMLSFAIATLLSAVCAVNAANTVVTVGMNSALAFTSDSITAAVGDTISFQFQAGNHSVTQTTFANPCTRMAGGFASGFHQAANATQFTITINDTNPIWYYCGQTQPLVHCHLGMVGAINALTTGNATFAAFQTAAKALASSTSSSTSAASSATAGASASTASGASSPSGTSNSTTPAASAAAMQIGGSTMGALTAMALLVGLAL